MADSRRNALRKSVQSVPISVPRIRKVCRYFYSPFDVAVFGPIECPKRGSVYTTQFRSLFKSKLLTKCGPVVSAYDEYIFESYQQGQ